MPYVAVKSYKATKDDEATIAIGAVVEVLQKSENGWWLIRYHSNEPGTALWRGKMAPLIIAICLRLLCGSPVSLSLSFIEQVQE